MNHAPAPAARRSPPRVPAFLVQAAALAASLTLASASWATVTLADQPVFTNTGVPGNLALALSVEFPTAISVAHTGTTYSPDTEYLGYFDPVKCYEYVWNADERERHFKPSGSATNRRCTAGQDAKWSGNFLNWASMQTVDPFRWALTGGYRYRDTTTDTWLERAWATPQGGIANFPNRALGTATLVSEATPFTTGTLNLRNWRMGNRMLFSSGGIGNAANTFPNVALTTAANTANPITGTTAWNPANAFVAGTIYEVSVRVKVCDNSVGAGPLESNCTAYPNNGNEIYKPTGLLQQYAEKIRYSAFGYLNDDNIQRDGGVLRARQKFISPTFTLPASPAAPNAAREWDPNTGIISINPDSADAATTTTVFGLTSPGNEIVNSGVMNYLNKFGQITPGSFKTFDPVGELYYAAIRYFKNLGNVPQWTNTGSANEATRRTWVDGFPVITTWDDPVMYSCQRNFVLGIGDVNTHADKNVPGNTPTGNEPAKPAAVTADTSVNTVTATNKVGELHGIANLGTTNPYNGCCNNNSALMAGLAYDSNTKDIRPDDAAKPQTKGKQTVTTYWLDILEYQAYKNNNQFYLAAKYGGFKVPDNFDPYTRTTDLPLEWWSTTGETVGGQNRPDAYFVASNPAAMVNGLTRAFADIANKLRAYTTSFSTALPQVSADGTASFSARYDAGSWTGELTASKLTFNNDGVPSLAEAWSFSNKLATLVSGTNWDTQRVMVTYRTDTGVGVPFRIGSLASTQAAALDTVYRNGNDRSEFLNYLRGDRSREEGQPAALPDGAYRRREGPIGDIVGSKAKPVGPPAAPYSAAANPGYPAFRTTWQNRPTMVYVGSNAGMMHAIVGSLDHAKTGREVFAYVPGGLYEGPNGVPIQTGLASRGDPDFTHRFLVDGPVGAFDIDFGRTLGAAAGNDWRTIIVGAMGKGGRRYFAIDVTDPTSMINAANSAAGETLVSSKVLWEFSNADLGYTFGEPAAVKTKAHGWVLIFGSGYNNPDGKGYFFIVNPRTGELIKKIGTGSGSVASEAGLAHVEAFVRDRTDGTADAVYAGDLHGKLWRLDLTDPAGNYPAPVQIALLTDGTQAATPLPVTTRPLPIVQPVTNKRWITVGTGRLLNSGDVGSSQAQAFFAIMDGNARRFAATPPVGSYPLSNGNLRKLTDLRQPVVLDLNTEAGWWIDLGAEAGRGWRVLNDSTAFFGRVAFAAMLPMADVCEPGGTNRVFAIDLGSGQSTLVDGSNQPIAYNSDLSGVVTDLRYYSVDGKPVLLGGTDTGQVGKNKERGLSGAGVRRLNWRELPLAD